MRLLVLGGTLFLGRAVVEAALRRGWSVTTFNRGKSGEDVPGARVLRGNRLEPSDVRHAVEAGPWDAVIDMAGYVPKQVHTLSRTLATVSRRYALVSTVSVYEGWPAEPLSEASVVLDCPPDAEEDFGPPDVEDGPTRYGRLKAGCERAVLDSFGHDRALIIRPGVVLGPREYVGRLPWWLRRVAAGGRVVAPGPPGRTIQPIDVRDTAEFLLNALVDDHMGTFNVAGPTNRDTFADLLDACKRTTASGAEIVWVADDVLLRRGVRQWSELPLWRTHRGVWSVDAAAAFAVGLRSRPLAETVTATWAWMQTAQQMLNERSAEIGLTQQHEAEILASVDQR
ncbi:NAD-dependent epimerase/dehydratase family protein [Micromonospora aurantiaca]|uniref:NAD-dependent epimerase/dehydratase family protein n=1 Tax=Micromonospora aurantiaca (nom. illeg.) TaxID=47850 RepID=UPI000F3C519B|nr:NAD-dependent epimerase/dehydratase family protein [Micromonospora aurantiaca]RNI00934.1 NAD-dependent epimerase/dehydratase family protein [Micromonospora aurantiaca]